MIGLTPLMDDSFFTSNKSPFLVQTWPKKVVLGGQFKQRITEYTKNCVRYVYNKLSWSKKNTDQAILL